MFRRDNWLGITILTLVAINFVLLFAGLEHFYIWKQIINHFELNLQAHTSWLGKVLDQEAKSSGMATGMDLSLVHMPRYFLMFPLIAVCKIFNFNYDLIFGMTIVTMMFLSWYLLSKVLSNLTNNQNQLMHLGLFLAINLFITQLNGRMFFAFMGMSLFIYIDQLVKRKSLNLAYIIVGLLLSLWLCSISSGAFLLVYGISIVWVLFFYKPLCSKQLCNKNFRLQQAALLVTLVLPYKIVYESIAKNIDFFGGGLHALLNMLNHGAGLFMKSKVSVVLLCITLLVTFFLWQRFKPKADVNFALFTLVIGLLGGLYGWSVTMVAFPAIFLITFVKLAELMPSIKSSQDGYHAYQ